MHIQLQSNTKGDHEQLPKNCFLSHILCSENNVTQPPKKCIYKHAGGVYINMHKCIYKHAPASQVVLVGKNPPAKSGDIRDVGLIPGLGRFPGGGNGNPLQYSCLESHGQRSLVSYNP